MFEVAELGHKVSKKEYEEQLPELRYGLLQAQEALKSADFPVIILVTGVDFAGKGHTINLLNEWMDPRYLRTFSFGELTDEERERPEYWRYWRSLPSKGRIGLYVGSWYSKPIAECVENICTPAELDDNLKRIVTFEETLVNDGALIIKFWLHLSQETQKKRLKSLEKDPKTHWRVTKQDHQHLAVYDHFISIAERTLRETSTGIAPWLILEGSDHRYRSLTIGQHILERINRHLQQKVRNGPPEPHLRPIAAPANGDNSISVLRALDMKKHLEKGVYKKSLAKYQGKIGELCRKAAEKKMSSIIVLEGWDAAGKGGIIRRIIPAMDARRYQVIPIAAPTDEEFAHHYLWRFWRHIPRAGHVTIYDRSWYGRVLVERVEGLTYKDDWMRAYNEINHFEERLIEHGIVLVKFWIHIDKDEQSARFKAREQIPFKKYKITEEDYRNREMWQAYEHAVNDMVERTSTEYAPWHLIEGNDKKYARAKVLEIYANHLKKSLKS
jgi:polyphosphate:AMP phosphotransferase